jgi:hypothetical protein
VVNPVGSASDVERNRPRGSHRRDGITERGQIQWLADRQLSASAAGSVHRTVSLMVPLPGSQCGVGNGRTIAWTAHDDEFRLVIGH